MGGCASGLRLCPGLCVLRELPDALLTSVSRSESQRTESSTFSQAPVGRRGIPAVERVPEAGPAGNPGRRPPRWLCDRGRGLGPCRGRLPPWEEEEEEEDGGRPQEFLTPVPGLESS